MKKEKFMTSKRRPRKKETKKRSKRGTGLAIPGSDKKFQREYPGQDPHFDIPGEIRPDYEAEMSEPKDEASKHKYPPPRKHPTFRKIWTQFIDNISVRENFNIGHLNILEILCDFFVEYEELQEFIRKRGRSYLSVGRQGEVWKFYPEVAQLQRVNIGIRDYTKMLGLILKKDHGLESGGEKDAWE